MKFKDLLKTVKGLITVKKETRKYLIYATIVVAILGIIGVAIQNNLNSKLAAEKAALEQLNEDRARSNAELKGQLEDLNSITDANLAEIGRLRRVGEETLLKLAKYGEELAVSKIKSKDLENQLEEAHESLAGSGLKNSFLGEQITTELRNYFPNAGHVFFSSTQEDLFRTNPETANLIYTVITENSVRVQLVTQLGEQVTTLEETGNNLTKLLDLKDEEILAYEALVIEYDETFDNLEAALSLERRTTENLERQISIMNRKNLFEKILPSLNVVLGPYYDPFRNQGGFAVAVGLGWRF